MVGGVVAAGRLPGPPAPSGSQPPAARPLSRMPHASPEVLSPPLAQARVASVLL
jgi:hypothetical protein